MMTLLMLMILTVSPAVPALPAAAGTPFMAPGSPAGDGAPATDRLELRKDGGPGHGPDQSYSIREEGARDLERFIGGKQVVFVAPYDIFVLLLIVVLVVVLIIVL